MDGMCVCACVCMCVCVCVSVCVCVCVLAHECTVAVKSYGTIEGLRKWWNETVQFQFQSS